MDYQLSKNYLYGATTLSKKSKIILGWGIAIFAVGYLFVGINCGPLMDDSTGFVLMILKGLMSVGGIIMIFVGALGGKQRVTDEEYDSNVRGDTNIIKSKAMLALGIDETEVQEIAPIAFEGYSFTGAKIEKQGIDKKYRSNKYHKVIIFFLANEVHVYKYTFDTTEQKSTEETEVYFYKDLVSVSTSYDTIEVLSRKIDCEYFKLTTAGGNALSVSILNSENAQQSINAMRALLREKKQTQSL